MRLFATTEKDCISIGALFVYISDDNDCITKKNYSKRVGLRSTSTRFVLHTHSDCVIKYGNFNDRPFIKLSAV